MSKPAAIFVAVAMAVTAGCVAVIARYGLALGFAESIAAGFAALAGITVVHLAFLRAQPKEDGRIAELERLMVGLESRFEALEERLFTVDAAASERARAVAGPLVEEVAALGGLVTTIAREVAAHDAALAALKEWEAPPPPPPAFAAPAKIRPPKLFDPGVLHGETEARAAWRPAADPALAFRIERALGEDRIEPYLQPIVALPSRRAVHYEAFCRLVDEGGVISARQFIAAAAAVGCAPEVDRRMFERCASIALRVSARGGGTLFVNLSPETLGDAAALGAISGLLDRQAELRRLIAIELSQADFEALLPDRRAALDGLAAQGMRIALDKVEDLRLDPEALARSGVRVAKVRAGRLLDPVAARGLAIHPADLSSLLGRHAIELVATHVEEERTVPELLDMEVRFAQGTLFAAPRPARPAAEQGAPAPRRAVSG